MSEQVARVAACHTAIDALRFYSAALIRTSREARRNRGRVSSKRSLRSDTRSPIDRGGFLFRYLRRPSRRRNRAALL